MHITANICKNPADLHRFAEIETITELAPFERENFTLVSRKILAFFNCQVAFPQVLRYVVWELFRRELLH